MLVVQHRSSKEAITAQSVPLWDRGITGLRGITMQLPNANFDCEIACATASAPCFEAMRSGCCMQLSKLHTAKLVAITHNYNI